MKIFFKDMHIKSNGRLVLAVLCYEDNLTVTDVRRFVTGIEENIVTLSVNLTQN
jgi:hypothetical protein